MYGTDATTRIMTALDSAKTNGNGKDYNIQTVKIYLTLNDEDHIDENVPQEQSDFENPNPS
jgi:hypothetical protein